MSFVKKNEIIELMDEITELCREVEGMGIPVQRKNILSDLLIDLETIENEAEEPYVIYIFNNGSEVREERIQLREGWSNYLLAKVKWMKDNYDWVPVLFKEELDLSVILKEGLKGAGKDGDKEV